MMQTKQEFYDIIYQYYADRVGDKISSTFLHGLTEKITDHYYDLYSRFIKQYPKSVKRYSTFKLDDLEHPHVMEITIKYFKSLLGDNYAEKTTIALNLSLDELQKFEDYMIAFYNK